jgi:hypothetical protein
MLKRLSLPLLLATPTAAVAHVKWFEDYNVAAEPVPVTTTLALANFWLAVGLVLIFFLVTAALERRGPGVAVSGGLDRVFRPLQDNADKFLIDVFAAFFIALFSIGGTYLTPELTTDNALIPWAQLVIALLVIFQRTRPVAAVAIVLLWALTLRDYDLFHLFDYLALGIGMAAYLLLSGLPNHKWHTHRFAVLRWGIALALMWSSMEKFMYPQWFLPLLEEKPFLAFGIPFGPYTTMAGVAEFTLGCGLLWTPLIRRLSAIALFTLMFAAVYPFGRVDLVGHAPILASLLVIAANPREDNYLLLEPGAKRAVLLVPAGLAVALAVTMGSYAGLHHAIYDRATGRVADLVQAQTREVEEENAPAPGGFWRSQGHFHPDRAGGGSPTAAMMGAMDDMHREINAAQVTGNPDHDFINLMVPHHASAAEMARIYLQSGRDPELRRLAEQIIAEQTREIEQMRAIARERPAPIATPSAQAPRPAHDHAGQ